MSSNRRRFMKRALESSVGTAGILALPALTGCGAAANPFRHGVASGDPLNHSVIIWTRVTPFNPVDQKPLSSLAVQWVVSLTPDMTQVVARGSTTADVQRDFCVKVDPQGLQASTTYYYQFESQGWLSPVGRTRTLAADNVTQLRFALVSCSNWQYGYFNAYREIAQRAELDAVIHLGDYIYEYGLDTYANSKVPERQHQPPHEIVSLSDYRARHAQYKLDPDCQEVHRQHPFIAIWDDHESADNSYQDGAANHAPEQGTWTDRKAAAIQAYFEWMPIRESQATHNSQIYRRFTFGRLLDLVLLDTRLVGRTKQAVVGDLNTLNSPEHRLLGEEQAQWLQAQLVDSQRKGIKWRALGQQVVMSQIAADQVGFNMDQWDGYPLERKRLFDAVNGDGINNLLVFTGDIHASLACELSPEPFKSGYYQPGTGKGALGVEFVVPAVTSPGIDDPVLAAAVSRVLVKNLPHLQMVNFYNRGYVVVDITESSVQADWHWFATVNWPNVGSYHGTSFGVDKGVAALYPVTQPLAKPKAAPLLAPQSAAHGK